MILLASAIKRMSYGLTNIGPYRAAIAAKKEEIESTTFFGRRYKDNRSALQFSKSIVQ